MSEKNGDKARFQKNRKRAVLRRARIRAMVAGAAAAEKPASGEKRRRAKG
jgi:hypothetical protein